MSKVDLKNSFSATCQVLSIGKGKSKKTGECYAFLNLITMSSGYNSTKLIMSAVCFERELKNKWQMIDGLVKGDYVEVKGYLQARRQTDNRYTDNDGKPSVRYVNQLVVEDINKLE